MPSSNEVQLKSEQIQRISYVHNSVVITPGEAYEQPPSITQNGSTWTIVLKADRSGSTGVAQQFDRQVGGAPHEYAPSGGGTGKSPTELNFYFGVDVTFNTGTVRVYLGQGHSGTRNNWWIGANAVVNTGTPTLVTIQNEQITQIFNMSGGVSDFNFAPQT